MLLILSAAWTVTLPAQAGSGSGVLTGLVRDTRGTPQMGAAVELLTPAAGEVAVALTDIHGRYRFDSVSAGPYALKVTAAAFLPTLRENIQIRGSHAIVNLTLNTLFEAAQWIPAQRRATDEGNDDWKWSLRSSVSRPILRFDEDGPVVLVGGAKAERQQRNVHTRLTLNAGSGSFGMSAAEAALEAAAADDANGLWMVRASVQNANTAPAGGVAAGLEKQIGQGLSQTELRTFAAAHQLSNLSLGNRDAVRVATFVLRGAESTRLEGLAEIAAGSEYELIRQSPEAGAAASEQVSAMRPFLTVRTNPDGQNSLSYRFATSRAFQGMDDVEAAEELPRFAIDHGSLVLESDSHHGIALRHQAGRGTVELGIYSDHFARPVVAGLSGTEDSRAQASSPSRAFIADTSSGVLRTIGQSYSSRGMHVSASERLAPELWATIEFSTGTALVLGPAPLRHSRDIEDAIASLSPRTTANAAVVLRGKVTQTGTVWHAAYRWQPADTLTAVDAFDNPSGDAYLSIYIRQPLFSTRQNNVEAIFDVRNLLAEGYQPLAGSPVTGAEGSTLVLAQQPRVIRGGLAFTF